MAGSMGMPGAQGQAGPTPAGFGTSPATQATPNKGYEAAGMQKLAMALKLLTETLPLVGANSEPGEAVLKSIQSLAKLVPPGALSPAGEKQQLTTMQTNAAKNNSMMQQMKAPAPGMQPGGGAPGGGGMPMGAGMAA